MKIGIEAERANLAQKTGVEHYAKQLILHLAKIDSRNQYVLYLRTRPQAWFNSLPPNFRVKVLPFPIFWTQLRLSLEMLLHPPDALFIPASALPLIHPKNSVVTIHDLAWFKFPQAFTSFMRFYLKWSSRFAIKHAKKVIAVSQATKKDIIKYYGADENKIIVIYHGCGEPDNYADNSALPIIAKLPQNYILFLSTLQPRKNLPALVEAVKILRQEYPNENYKLVVGGKPGWKYEPILNLIKVNKDFVVYLGHLNDAEKWAAYSKARVLAMPSLYEGFGMWILEAFAAGIPVAISNVSSMPEVAGDAAVYFNPNNPKDIASQIAKVLNNPEFAQSLISRGKKRLADFSWDKCASQTLQVLA